MLRKRTFKFDEFATRMKCKSTADLLFHLKKELRLEPHVLVETWLSE